LFRCRCGRPLFFRNSKCLGCGAEVGYDPELALLLILPDGATPPCRISPGRGRRGAERTYLRCANYSRATGCNWLVAVADNSSSAAALQCASCRLTRITPDLSVAENGVWWARIEDAKRQLVSTLITLGLPVRARTTEDPQRGLAFDLLRSPPDGPHVITGHADGVVTIDIEEADDATREKRRAAMHEPYRTMLGHLRHEIGHYYWYRLISDSRWLGEFRELFGDDRADYDAALRKHHDEGPISDWALAYVSAYASAHPWEDWAETWAHYLHMIDALDTALSFGVSARAIEATFEPFPREALAAGAGKPGADAFLVFVNAWVELATALNELSRSMGQPEFYPFVLSAAAVRKLHFVHRIVTDRTGRQRRRRSAKDPRVSGTPVADVAD
jgi:hypothetical protein